MGVLDRIPREQLGTRYTHRGWMWFCPVYIGAPHSSCPDLTARNWVPDWVFDLAVQIDRLLAMAGSIIDPDFEPAFVFVITGTIDPPQAK